MKALSKVAAAMAMFAIMLVAPRVAWAAHMFQLVSVDGSALKVRVLPNSGATVQDLERSYVARIFEQKTAERGVQRSLTWRMVHGANSGTTIPGCRTIAGNKVSFTYSPAKPGDISPWSMPGCDPWLALMGGSVLTLRYDAADTAGQSPAEAEPGDDMRIENDPVASAAGASPSSDEYRALLAERDQLKNEREKLAREKATLIVERDALREDAKRKKVEILTLEASQPGVLSYLFIFMLGGIAFSMLVRIVRALRRKPIELDPEADADVANDRDRSTDHSRRRPASSDMSLQQDARYDQVSGENAQLRQQVADLTRRLQSASEGSESGQKPPSRRRQSFLVGAFGHGSADTLPGIQAATSPSDDDDGDTTVRRPKTGLKGPDLEDLAIKAEKEKVAAVQETERLKDQLRTVASSHEAAVRDRDEFKGALALETERREALERDLQKIQAKAQVEPSEDDDRPTLNPEDLSSIATFAQLRRKVEFLERDLKEATEALLAERKEAQKGQDAERKEYEKIVKELDATIQGRIALDGLVAELVSYVKVLEDGLSLPSEERRAESFLTAAPTAPEVSGERLAPAPPAEEVPTRDDDRGSMEMPRSVFLKVPLPAEVLRLRSQSRPLHRPTPTKEPPADEKRLSEGS